MGGRMSRTNLLVSYGALALAFAVAVAHAADDRGAPIFGDSFDAVGTFAENWVSKGASSAGGRVVLPNGAWMRPRGEQPLEFVAEADITLQPPRDGRPPVAQQSGWAGFMIDGHHFQMQPCGRGFVVWKLPGEKRSSGRYERIESFELGKPVHLRLVRRAIPGAGGAVKYAFEIGGQAAGEFIAPAPAAKVGDDGREHYAPLSLSGYRIDFEVDDFLLSSVRHGDESPNTVFNSGFEHGVDGVPLYYGLLGGFDFLNRPASEYETRFLRRFSMDSDERHSGNYSLRVEVNDASRGIGVAPWQTGTVKGMAGVFSVWMKASVDGLPVTLTLAPQKGDGRKVVTVGRTWARYEVTRAELPGKGTYSPVKITLNGPFASEAVLWIDDVQCEVVALPEGGRFDPAKTYATPYRPSGLDASRFGAPLPPPRLVRYAAKMLPTGVRPSPELDSWKGHAEEVGEFWNGTKRPTRGVRAYLACDSENLYVGFRNFGEGAKSLRRPPGARDAMTYMHDGLELFFKPSPDGEPYHFMASPNGDRFDCRGNDMTWNGSWTVAAMENAAAGAVDYLVTIPFADFVEGGISRTWRVNLCRNDHADGHEPVSSGRRADGEMFRKESTWNELSLPAEVAAKWLCAPRKAGGGAAASVLGRLDYYMDEPEAAWRVTDADGRVFTVRKPMSEIPYGTNVVSFSADGRTYSDTVVRLPFRKEATQINRWTRSVVHGGRNEVFTGPFLGVVGWFGDPQGVGYPKMTGFLREKGFRHVAMLTPSWSRCAKEAKAFMDAVSGSGLLYLNFCEYGRNVGGPDRRNDLAPEAMVDFFRPYEGVILSNMVIDEPELYMKGDETKAWLGRMKAAYPYLPVQMNNTVMGIPSRFADLKTDILMLDDYLTNNENRTVDSIVRQVDVMTAASNGRPCWFFIVSDNMTLHYRNPSYAEQVAQSWGCLCAGCTGLAWYLGFPATEGTWRAMVDVNREAQELAPVILSEELCGEAVCDAPKSRIRHMTRTLDGSWYVLSCNVDAAPVDRATYVLPADAPREGTVEVLFENRSVPLAGGTFSDSYAPHARHLYRVSKQKGASQ